MRSAAAASGALLVLCMACLAVTSAAVEPQTAVAGQLRRMLQKQRQQQIKSAPCMHTQAAKQTGTTAALSNNAQPKQALQGAAGAAVAVQANRQLLQVTPRPKRPAPALNPATRQGFATARVALPPAQVQRQQRGVPARG